MAGGLMAACHFFAVKTLPFVDIAVGGVSFCYHVDVQKSLQANSRKVAGNKGSVKDFSQNGLQGPG